MIPAASRVLLHHVTLPDHSSTVLVLGDQKGGVVALATFPELADQRLYRLFVPPQVAGPQSPAHLSALDFKGVGIPPVLVVAAFDPARKEWWVKPTTNTPQGSLFS